MHVVSGGHLFQAIEQVLTVYRARTKMLLRAWPMGQKGGTSKTIAWHRIIHCKHLQTSLYVCRCMLIYVVCPCNPLHFPSFSTAPGLEESASELRHPHCATFFDGHFGQNCQYDLDGKFASSLDSHFYAKTIYIILIILHPFTIVYQQKLVANGGTFAVSTASTKAEWVDLHTWHLDIEKTTLMFRSAIASM